MEDKFILGGKEFHSRFILGSGKYNLNLIKAAVEQGGAEIITLALRRANTQESENILDFIPKGVTLLPNTSGARTTSQVLPVSLHLNALRSTMVLVILSSKIWMAVVRLTVEKELLMIMVT